MRGCASVQDARPHSNVGVLDGPLVLHVARNEGRYGRSTSRSAPRCRARHVARRVLLAFESEANVTRRYADHDLTLHTVDDHVLPLLLADLREIRQKKFAFSFG